MGILKIHEESCQITNSIKKKKKKKNPLAAWYHSEEKLLQFGLGVFEQQNLDTAKAVVP